MGIISFGEKVYANPETGYKEIKTTELAAGIFEKMGLSYERPDGITGLKATLDTGRQGPSVAILGELDSVVCPDHTHSNRDTDAVHACGGCAP